jgi:N-acetylglucosaminyldiphosphoundecaprenol N-acetyl-beta-D-mannosaminyltransferase
MIAGSEARKSFNKFLINLPFQMSPRSNVLGVGISPLNLSLAIEQILIAASRPEFMGYVTVTGVHGVMECQRDSDLKRIHNQSFLSAPDGMPMVWMGWWNGFRAMNRVYGPDLMLELMAATSVSGEKHFFFGGGVGVVDKLADNLRGKYEGVSIVGMSTPPFRPLTSEEEMEVVASIQATRPHFFWVGLSTPKQERFMDSFLKHHSDLTQDWDHGLIMLGVGAAFDFHAGLVRQAPAWMQKSGFEWLFRLCMEPKRLWKRYLYNNPRFIWGIFLQITGFRKHGIS